MKKATKIRKKETFRPKKIGNYEYRRVTNCEMENFLIGQDRVKQIKAQRTRQYEHARVSRMEETPTLSKIIY